MNIRLTATRYIWTGYTLAMLAIFAGTAIMNQAIGAGHIVMGVVISMTAFLSTGTIWNWGNLPVEAEQRHSTHYSKRKNQHQLDQMLERLSEDERETLREILAKEETGYALVDDGELVMRRSR